jgi:hypothetical protein
MMENREVLSSTNTAFKPSTTATSTTSKTSKATTPTSPKSIEVTGQLIAKRIIDFGEQKECPTFLKPHMKTIANVIVKLFFVIETLLPVLQKIYIALNEFYVKLKPYKPELLLPGFTGLIMCFFGGSYLTLIAAVEAFNLTSSSTVIDSVKILYSDFQKVLYANEKDNTKDENNDGVADVLQISTKELLHRKTVLFLKTMDPHRLMIACAAIQTGFLAIIATLKLEFAKTITLGNAIYGTIEPPIMEHVLPKFEALFPEDYRKWAKPLLSSVLRSFVISWAWFLQRIISAFHSAMKGNNIMFLTFFIFFLFLLSLLCFLSFPSISVFSLSLISVLLIQRDWNGHFLLRLSCSLCVLSLCTLSVFFLPSNKK